MKLKHLAIILGVALSVNAAAAQTSSIALSHEGNVTFFPGFNLAPAIEQAQRGDTIYLSNGVYEGFTLDKAVAVIGAGQRTEIAGSVRLDFSDTISIQLLDAINIHDVIELTSSAFKISDIKFRKIRFKNLQLYYPDCLQNVTFDRCVIYGSLSCSGAKSTSFLNCKIANLNDADSSQLFQNCNIEKLSYSNKTNIYNSIIGANSDSYSDTYFRNYRFVSCLFSNGIANFSDGCYHVDDMVHDGEGAIIDENMECIMTAEELKAKSYIGNDGTVVGIYGGGIPFTLVPSLPTVSESTLTVDPETKKLNVTVKIVSAE